jgi:hypothetical protein
VLGRRHRHLELGGGARQRDRHERVAIGGVVAERPPAEALPEPEAVQLHAGPVAVVAGQQREVDVGHRVERLEQRLDPRQRAMVPGTRVLDLLREQGDVARPELAGLRLAGGDAGALAGPREDELVGAPRERDLGQRVGDAEGLLEGAGHRPLAGAAGQHERAVDVEQQQARGQSSCSWWMSAARGPLPVDSLLKPTRSPSQRASKPGGRTPSRTKNQSWWLSSRMNPKPSRASIRSTVP